MVVHLQSETTPVLGRLSRVDVREVWAREAVGFTPWLAQEENLQILAETINMHLILEAREKHIGPFRADILARDVPTGHLVLIENQLERTDHGHLGQLITYAAGLKATAIVWVSTLFTDEHRAALDWLNEITNSNIAFFGLEMELWRIDDSAIAPKFNLVSRPNTFSRLVNQTNQARFDKAAFIHQMLTVRPELRNADIQRLAAEQGITISPAYISETRKAFLEEQTA
jgi:hypothetical protein